MDQAVIALAGHLRLLGLVLGLVWTLVVTLSFAWNLRQQEQNTQETARLYARTLFQTDLIYRAWNAGHGGVYVPVTDRTPPNPYLADRPNRDITTSDGRQLTLVNPAYMTRQVHELARAQIGTLGHITSLKPIRPQNAPDGWEADALKRFESGEVEVSALANIDGQEYMRLMRPLRTTTDCLACHERQGYRIGDVRGGISESVPMAPLRALAGQVTDGLIAVHLIFWLIGLGGLGVASHRLARAARIVRTLSLAIDQSPVSVLITDAEGRIVYVNRNFLRTAGEEERSLVGSGPHHPTSAFAGSREYQQVLELIAAQRSWSGETSYRHADGRLTSEATSIVPVSDNGGRLVNYVVIKTDISERKNTELALRESERRLREKSELLQAATDNLPIGFAITGLDTGRFVYRNKPFERFLGIQPDLLGDFGGFLTRLFDDRARAREVASAMLSEASGAARPCRWENVRLSPPGQPLVVVDAMAVPIPRHRLMISLVADATDRHLAEEARRRERALDHALAELGRTLLTNDDLTLDSVSALIRDAGLELTESRRGAALYLDAKGALVSGPAIDDEPALEPVVAAARAVLDHCRSLLAEDQSPGARFVAAPVLVGKAAVGLVVFTGARTSYDDRDLAVCERLADFYALALRHHRSRASLRTFRRVLEQTPVSVMVTDTAGAIEYVNPKFERLTGYRSAEVIGQNPRLLKSGFTSSGDYSALWQTISGGGVWRGEFHNRRKTGQLFWELASIAPVFDDTGVITGYVAVKEDITSLKQKEAELLIAKERAEAASNAKSRFLAVMSHELRTPLNAIIGFSELIRDRLLGPLDQRYEDYIRHIHESGTHLLDLINGILDLSKIESGSYRLVEHNVDLATAITASLTMVEPRAERGNLTLARDLPPVLPDLRADERALKQILINLLSNAVKFTETGGRVTVRVSIEEDGALVLAVADTGIGIAPEDIPIALQPFGQIDNSLTRAHGGTGIGLPLARMLAEAHNASLRIDSAPGVGTTVSVRFAADRVVMPAVEGTDGVATVDASTGDPVIPTNVESDPLPL